MIWLLENVLKEILIVFMIGKVHQAKEISDLMDKNGLSIEIKGFSCSVNRYSVIFFAYIYYKKNWRL